MVLIKSIATAQLLKKKQSMSKKKNKNKIKKITKKKK
jgi:hypothetical protein